jgi:hypothetical protein
MWTHIQRRKSIDDQKFPEHAKEVWELANLSFSQLKGIYKCNNLKTKKIRTKNKNVRHLYDYNALACFEYLHFDTKTILDQKALPSKIYDKFDLNDELPIIEWNIIDAKSRFRFIAYSHNRSSEFGLNFLIFVLQFIRSHTIFPDIKIIIGTDNGSEFFSGSKRKMKEWNKILDILNAEIYAYDPRFDVRKNLIERSHKTDDKEFFVPRGDFINDKKSFLFEAKNYSDYFNSLRPHSGIGMDNKTPLEKLMNSGIYNAKKFISFPTMILEDRMSEIKKSTEIIRLVSFLKNQKRSFSELFSDQNFMANLRANFKYISKSAQNVLRQYLSLFKTT